MDPPVCDPIDAGAINEATEAADPLEEPPGVLVLSCGFVVAGGPKSVSYTHLTLPTKA